jgi:hypothetical protein
VRAIRTVPYAPVGAQLPHRLADRDPTKFGVKIDDAAALTTAKAFPEILFGVDREAGRSFFVQRAQAFPPRTVSLELPAPRLAVVQKWVGGEDVFTRVFVFGGVHRLPPQIKDSGSLQRRALLPLGICALKRSK